MDETEYVLVGTFATERMAAIGYDLEAQRIYGEFAHRNVPDASPEEIAAVRNRIANPKKWGVTSRYFGVWCERGKWRYHVIYKGHRYLSARFETELEAAQARDSHIIGRGIPKRLSLVAIK